ncbi:MAG: SLATT domain-containing protein [Chlorobiales bacterium]|nr:SLATT domain-containing protein [Chlorobiales bacterium]
MRNLLNILKQIRADAIFGKKKHFNAADRKEKYNHRISLLVAITSLFASSSLFYSIIQTKFFYTENISLVLVLLIMILSWVQIYFNWQKEAYEHRRIANKYLGLAKKCSIVVSQIEDKIIDENALVKEVNALSLLINEINKDADSHPTNNNDYQMARKGIEEGEEIYTEKDAIG